MERLRTRYLNVALTAVLHPATPMAQQAGRDQKDAADAAPPGEKALSAQQWFELGVAATDHNDEIRFNTEAIRLNRKFPEAFYNRGVALHGNGDFDAALKDYTEAIRLKPDYAQAFNNRGTALDDKGDLDGALKDFAEAIRLQPDYADAFNNRGVARKAKGVEKDYGFALKLVPFVRRHRSNLERSIRRALTWQFMYLPTAPWRWGRLKWVPRFAAPSRRLSPRNGDG